MSIKTFTAGQQDWANILINDLAEIGDPGSKVGLTFLNGWTSVSDENCYAKKIPLPNGTTLKVISVAMRNTNVNAGASFDPVVVVPAGYESTIPQPIGKVYDVQVSGHFQGTINWFFNSHGLGANYNPIDGGMGPYDMAVWSTILYF